MVIDIIFILLFMTTAVISKLGYSSAFGLTPALLEPEDHSSPKFQEENQDVFFKSQISLAETC
jgi:hypothetical protein